MNNDTARLGVQVHITYLETQIKNLEQKAQLLREKLVPLYELNGHLGGLDDVHDRDREMTEFSATLYRHRVTDFECTLCNFFRLPWEPKERVGTRFKHAAIDSFGCHHILGPKAAKARSRV